MSETDHRIYDEGLAYHVAHGEKLYCELALRAFTLGLSEEFRDNSLAVADGEGALAAKEYGGEPQPSLDYYHNAEDPYLVKATRDDVLEFAELRNHSKSTATRLWNLLLASTSDTSRGENGKLLDRSVLEVNEVRIDEDLILAAPLLPKFGEGMTKLLADYYYSRVAADTPRSE